MIMKQISLRLDDELHAFLTEEAKASKKSLSQHLTDLLCQRGHLYTTNFNHKIQVRFNLTHLGDLLVLGRHESFNGLYNVMVDSINQGYTVILERHYTNASPTELYAFTDINELESWKNAITTIK